MKFSWGKNWNQKWRHFHLNSWSFQNRKWCYHDEWSFNRCQLLISNKLCCWNCNQCDCWRSISWFGWAWWRISIWNDGKNHLFYSVIGFKKNFSMANKKPVRSMLVTKWHLMLHQKARSPKIYHSPSLNVLLRITNLVFLTQLFKIHVPTVWSTWPSINFHRMNLLKWHTLPSNSFN